MNRRRILQVVVLASLALLTAGGWTAARIFNDKALLFANADDPSMTKQGARTYLRLCRGCHGGRLQGQPFWRLVDADFGRRAPALDGTGYAWMRSDDELFQMIKYGRYNQRHDASESQMPAFQGTLDDQDIYAALAFVKVTWPVSQRALQALRNPNQRGMPADARTADWLLPATCFPHDALASTQVPR